MNASVTALRAQAVPPSTTRRRATPLPSPTDLRQRLPLSAALAAQVHPRCLSRSLLVSLDYTVVTMGENVEARLLASTMFSCALMPFVKNHPIGKRVPMERFWYQA